MIAKLRSFLNSEKGLAMVLVIGFMAVSIPLLTGALALGGSLSADSRVKLEIAKSQYSNIGALEYIRYLSDAPENWNDWLEETGGLETLEIGDESVEIEANGNGVSDYGFLDYCIFGESEVEIGERSDIQCSIGSNGDVEIEGGSTIRTDGEPVHPGHERGLSRDRLNADVSGRHHAVARLLPAAPLRALAQRSSRLRILPVGPFGRASRNSTMRGYL